MKGELAFLANSKNASAAFNSRPTLLNGSIISAPPRGHSAPCRGRREEVAVVKWWKCCGNAVGNLLFEAGVHRRPLCSRWTMGSFPTLENRPREKMNAERCVRGRQPKDDAHVYRQFRLASD